MKTVLKALSAVQRDIAAQGIGKNQENTYDKYRFRGIDDVLNALAPILAKHGVLIVPSMTDCEIRTITSAKGQSMHHAKAWVNYTIYDAEGDSITHRFCGEAIDRGDKSINKAATSAYKYFLFEALCIPVEGTPDADSESHEVGEPLVSQDDIDSLTAILAAGDPIAYAEFQQKYTDEQWTELFNAAPKGQKTAWKQAVRDLHKAYIDTITEYYEALIEAVEAGDSHAVDEVMGELTPFEKQSVWARLSDIEKHKVKQVKEAA